MDKIILRHFEKVDPILYETARRIEIKKVPRSGDYFEDLIQTIVNQQLSGKAAATIFGRFKKLLPQDKVLAENILKIEDRKIREAGVSFSKIRYIKGVSAAVVKKELLLNKFDNDQDEIVIEELIKLKGIGKWSAEMFLMFTLRRPDVFSFGDQGLKNAIRKLYKLNAEPTISQMEKISYKWKPYRTYAARILWATLD